MRYQEVINSPFMYLLGSIVAIFVLIQSTIFLIRAYRRGIAIGMGKKKLLGVIRNSALFTIVPSLSIVIALFSMVKALGVPIPWIRLSVIGAVTYELPVAEQAAKAMGMVNGLASSNFTLDVFAGVVLTMSIGIIWGILMCLFGGVKLLDKGMSKMQKTDRKWGELFVSAMFMGLVAAFAGYLITPPLISVITKNSPVYLGVTSILVLISSVLIMFLMMSLAKKKERLKWLESFALPVSMVLSMGLAIFYYRILGGSF